MLPSVVRRLVTRGGRNCPDTFRFHLLFPRTLAITPHSYTFSAADSLNELCRILSDFRQPHHGLESALDLFPGNISGELVEGALKKCSNLATPCYRFFLWTSKSRNVTHSKASYHILVSILGSAAQFPLVWDLLLQMKNSRTGVHGGNVDAELITNEIFWVVFRSYSKALLPVDAIRSFRKMPDFGVTPTQTDLDELLFSLCKSSLVKWAQEFFDEVKAFFSPSPKTYTILINGWGDANNSEKSRELMDELVDLGGTVDVATYNALLSSLCKSEKIDDAQQMFGEMGRFNLVPDVCSYSIFARAYCDSGDIWSALRIFDRMRRYGFTPNVYTYNSLIKALCKNQRVEDAYAILDEMVQKGLRPDIWSFNSILTIHCERREVNRALKLLKRMDKDSCNPDKHSYNMILKMLIMGGRFDRAADVWDTMESRGFYPSVVTYAVMVHGFCKKKRVEDACKHFETMIDEGVPPYATTCETLRNLLLEMGLKDRVERLFCKMHRSTSCPIQELSSIMDTASVANWIPVQSKKPSKAHPRSRRKERKVVEESKKQYWRYTF